MPELCIANTIIPFFSYQPLAELYLLIPIVILESFILKWFLKLPFGTVILNCLIANILSTLCAVAVYPLDMIGMALAHSMSVLVLAGLLLLLSLLAICFLISYYVERWYYLYKWKDQPAKLVSRATFYANLATYIPILILMWVFSENYYQHRMPKGRRISCASNLKQIGLGISQYALDNNNSFLDGHGAAGLEKLRSQSYLTDYKIFICPTATLDGKAKRGKDNSPLTEETVSYLYFGEGMSAIDSPDSPIACDKPGNHENFGNVLFVDGHVQGYAGANWMEKAKIPEKERAAK